MTVIRHQLNDQQFQQLCALYAEPWWTRDRDREGIRQMLDGSDLLFALCESAAGALFGFARVITDHRYKALILDVIVSPERQGDGHARQLMDAIVSHPSLQDVQDLELYCLPEMFPLYQKWGFTRELGELRLMCRRQA